MAYSKNCPTLVCRAAASDTDNPQVSDALRFAKAIGVTVKRLRREREWTQETLAEKSGVTQAYISAVEAGRVFMSWKKMELICNQFSLEFTGLLEHTLLGGRNVDVNEAAALRHILAAWKVADAACNQ